MTHMYSKKKQLQIKIFSERITKIAAHTLQTLAESQGRYRLCPEADQYIHLSTFHGFQSFKKKATLPPQKS